MSALIEAQDAFFDNLAKLKLWVKANRPGWRLTLAEAGVALNRTVIIEGRKLKAVDRVHRLGSLHYERLAADINLFVPREDGTGLRHVTRSDAPEWAVIHAAWLSIDPENQVMPSSSSDANHLSRDPRHGDPRI